MFAYCNNSPIIRADNGGNIFVIVVPGASSDDESNQTYTEKNVNVFMEGEGEYDPNKLNIRFYRTSDGFVNINVENSISITDNVEQREVLKLITNSKYYDVDTYGDIDFMQAQWISHNVSYNIASSGSFGLWAMQYISGSSTPIESSKNLDLRANGNMLKRQRFIYKVISAFCGPVRRYPIPVNAQQTKV